MRINKDRNWREIVKELKNSPPFGIHGTSKKNADSIMISQDNWMMGHYFHAGEEQKRLSDAEYYQRLFSSATIALGKSCKFDIQDSKLSFNSEPTLIVGVDVNYKEGENLEGNSTCFSTVYGNTFGVGHEFYKFEGIEIKRISLDSSDISTFQDKLTKYTLSLKNPYGLEISQAYLVQALCVKELIKKINREISARSLDSIVN